MDEATKYIAAAVHGDAADNVIYGYNMSRQSQFECPTHIISALSACDSFRSMDEQADELSKRGFGGLERSEQMRILRALEERGLLISDREVRTQFAESASAAGSSPRIGSLYVPTRNRPHLVSRCLRSHITNSGRKVVFHVIDDSDLATGKEVQRSLAALADETGTDIRIAREEEKRGYLERLRDRLGPDAEGVKALDGILNNPYGLSHRYGTNRNWILLGSAGSPFCSADDDTVAEGLGPDWTTERMRLSAAQDPTDLRTFDGIPQLLSAHPTTAIDPFEAHEQVFRRLYAAASEDVGELSVEDMNVGLVRRVMSNEVMPRATALGLAGDPGRAGFQFLLRAEGQTRDEVCRDRETLLRSLTAPAALRRVPSTTFSDGTYFMSTHFAADNSTLMPPFFPVGHNDDGVFSETLLALDSSALIGHSPVAVLHDPERGRKPTVESIKSVRTGVTLFAGMLLHEHRPLSVREDLESALQRAGALLRSMTSLSGQDFEALLLIHWRRFLSTELAGFERSLEKYRGYPSFWAEQVEDMMDRLRAELLSPEIPVPGELSGAPDRRSAIGLLSSILNDFGVALQWWPEVWRVAREMNANGFNLTVPVVAE